jgi:hypothetical protein
MSIYIPTWPKITNALGSTTTEFGGSDWANLISDYYNGENLALVDASKLPVIGSLTRYKFEKLALLDADQSHHIVFSADDIDTGGTRKIKFRRMNSPFTEDYAVLEGLSQEMINKEMDGTLNTFSNIPYSALTGTPTSLTPTAHATSHKSGGSDAIKLDELAAPTDITTLNATTSLHGLLKKLSNSASQYMDGTGNWSTPQGVPGVINTLTDVDTVTAAPTNNQVLTWNSTSSQWVPATPPGASGGEANLGANVGTGDATIFRDKTGVTLNFKRLVQGSNITLTNNTDTVTVAASAGATNLDGLSDVVITSPATQQIVYHNGTNWVNSTSTPFKNGPFLYHIYIDPADSKYKALNLDTLAIEFVSSGTTDALAVFNSVIAAASTAKRPIFIDKGKYLFSAQLDVSGKWLKIVGTRIGGNSGGQGDYTNETVLKKAYTDNTNPFIKWDNTSIYTKQQWERITIEGKDTGDNGTGSDFDNGGIGMYIKSANECYEAFKDVMFCHFGTALKLQTVWQFNFYGLCIYDSGAVAIELTWDGSNRSTQCVCNYFYGGEVRRAPIDVLLTCANDTAFFGMMLEGYSGHINAVKILSTASNTRLYGVSFESPKQGAEIIEDAGYGLLCQGARFAGLSFTAQTIYRAKSGAYGAHIINNTIEAYENNAVVSIILDSGSTNMTIKHNNMVASGVNPTLTITDNSGNATTNDIGPNAQHTTSLGAKFGPPMTHLSPLNVQSDTNENILNLYNSASGATPFRYSIMNFDLQSSTAVRKTFGRIYATSDDNTNGAEYTWIGFDYIVGGVFQQRAMFYNNGLVVGIPGQRVRLESLNLTANRVYTTENFDGRLLNHNSPVVQSPLVKRWGAYQPAAGTTAATVGALSGMLMQHTPTGGGSNTTTFDATEGQIINLVSAASANVNAGLVSTAAGGVMVRRAFKTKATIRCKIDSTTASRFYFGFTSNAVLPVTDTPLAATGEHGVIVGFNSTDANYTIRTNDGATSVTSTALSTPTAKNANFHTITIEWTASGNIVVTFDNIVTTVSTDLPGTTTNLYFNAVAQTTTTTAKTLTVRGIWIETEG